MRGKQITASSKQDQRLDSLSLVQRLGNVIKATATGSITLGVWLLSCLRAAPVTPGKWLCYTKEEARKGKIRQMGKKANKQTFNPTLHLQL